MKYDPEKSFGYPVLSADSDDYIKSSFQTSFTFDLNRECLTEFKLDYTLKLGLKAMKELIDNDFASYWIKVACRATFYSKMYEVEEDGTLIIDGTMLRDSVEFSGFIIAKSELTLTSTKINPEFGYDSFVAHSGQVLAQESPSVYIIDKDFWRPISSIFEYKSDEDLKSGEFTLDLEEQYVTIFASNDQLTRFKQFEKSPSGRVVLLNTVYFVAVSKMIDAINEQPDEYEQKKWAQILEAKAVARRIDLKDRRSFVAAQRLLERPLGKLTDVFLET